MSLLESLKNRATSKCELCSSPDNLSVHLVAPKTEEIEENCALLCQKCVNQITVDEKLDPNHWRCLIESMWSEFAPIQVLSWRLLNSLQNESFAGDLLTQMYLDEQTQSWAMELSSKIITKDSNGQQLKQGDAVTLIKDLDVKGTGFTAKRGTTVKPIYLTDNPEHIEGRVNGVKIVILTKFTKKL